MIKKISFALLLGGGLILSGCGGGGDDSTEPTTLTPSTTTPTTTTTTNTDNTDTSDAYTGYVIDAPVEGLDYKCINSVGQTVTSGTTDADGKFTYTADSYTCEFGVNYNGEFLQFFMMNNAGFEELPPNLVYFPTTSAFLLQSLDNDGDMNNGIQITDDEKNVLTQNYDGNDLFTLTSASGVVSVLQANDPNYNGHEVDAATGMSNITNTMLNTIPTGTYKGTFTLTSGDQDYCIPSGEVSLSISNVENQIMVSGTAGTSDEGYNISGSFSGMLNAVLDDDDYTLMLGYYTADKKFYGYYKDAYCQGVWEVSLQQ